MRQLRRKTQIRKFLAEHPMPERRLAVWMQDWEDAYNVGGMFRVADAVGAHELVASGKTPVPPNPMVGVTSMGAHRRVPIRQFERHDAAAEYLVGAGYTLIAVEIAADAEPYHRFEYPERVCLVLGNEGAGVYDHVLRRCAGSVFVPMAGKGRSINVHVAAAVVAFQARLSPLPTSEPGSARDRGAAGNADREGQESPKMGHKAGDGTDYPH
ncbi:MAG: TrmH family RNA methyltransferase [Fimbriimonadaceae bacterium]|nr:TrmH family RNA methyltransferase [Fimbriimonadaceae bacterium]